MAKHQLTLYGRNECHLCQDMQNDLTILQQEHDFELQFIDIDRDSRLVELYGLRIPVLFAGQTEICHYFLDKQALLQYFEQG